MQLFSSLVSKLSSWNGPLSSFLLYFLLCFTDPVWAQAPTISVNAPSSVVAGAGFSVDWSATNATKVSVYCWANTASYPISGSGLPVSGTASGTAPLAAKTIDCTWYAFGPVTPAAIARASIAVIAPAPPTISVSRSPSPMSPGQGYTVSWRTTNATSVSSSCESVSATSGSRSGTALSAWVSSPPSCTWTASGPGGSASTSEILSTVANPPSITGSAPKSVQIGQNFTVGWKLRKLNIRLIQNR